MRTRVGVWSAMLLGVGGCGSDPTTMLRVPTDPRVAPQQIVIDSRTGVMAMHETIEDHDFTSFRRIVDGEYEIVAPRLELVSLPRIAFHDGSVLTSDEPTRTLRRFLPDRGWETFSFEECDLAVGGRLGDAPAMDDAWLIAQGPSTEGASWLCHFDGEHMTFVEDVPDGLQDVVALDDQLFAIAGGIFAAFGEVRVRAIDGGTWTPIVGLPSELHPRSLLARPDAVFVELESRLGAREPYQWWRIHGESSERIDGRPGFAGEVWRVVSEIPSGGAGCTEIGGAFHCETSFGLRVQRVDTTPAIDMGYLQIDDPDSRDTPFELHVLGEGLLLLTSPGSYWVTPPRAP